MRIAGVFLVCLTVTAPLNAQYMYKTQLVRAAPGKLLELIDLLKDRMDYYDRAGDQRPFMMRHSQGDHWDLLLLYPIGSYGEYYAAARVQDREEAGRNSEIDTPTFEQQFQEFVAWDEDVFVTGPALEVVREAFQGAGFFHVEMFLALPGKNVELYKQRQMENVFLEHLGRPQNLIFTRDQGAAWDAYTLGFYRDIKHFAESADIPEEDEDKAARIAGFDGVKHISPYMRSLISRHNDTLAVAVR